MVVNSLQIRQYFTEYDAQRTINLLAAQPFDLILTAFFATLIHLFLKLINML